MILKTLKIGLFVVALCSTSLVIGQEGSGKKKGNPEEILKKLDADANGSVSLEEFKAKRIREASKEAMLDERFKTLDADTNGEVTIEEFKAQKEKSKEELLQQRFQKLDSDGNGSVSYSEYKTFTENNKHFRRQGKRRPNNED